MIEQLVVVYAFGLLTVGWIAMGIYVTEINPDADILAACAVWFFWPIVIPVALVVGAFRLFVW